MKKFLSMALCVVCVAGMLAGCAGKPTADEAAAGEEIVINNQDTALAGNTDDLKNDSAYLDTAQVTGDEAAADAEAMKSVTGNGIALMADLMPEASGEKVKETSQAIIDYSHTEDGYVMVKWKNATTKVIKVLIYGPGVTKQADAWQYDCTPGSWDVFPLSHGNGSYKLTVHEQISGDRYSTIMTLNFDVKLTDEFAPFIRPNQYVNYAENADLALAKAAELVNPEAGVFDNISAVYNYVVKNFTYDKQKAKTVQSGYVPNLNDVMNAKTGICFDYASLMTAMLRSQGYPCRLVVGYCGSAYHAWVSVWSEETGWIDGAIFFDGQTWQRMDPTFASSGKQSSAIMKYIGNGSNYQQKFLY